MSVKPNFFIVGAAKSGTTSLANALNNHKSIFIPKIKEPMYFIPNVGVKTLTDYLALYSEVHGATVIGDASTGYLYNEDAPQKIFEFNRDAKILIVLRNPIDMMYSFWQYMTVSGSEQLGFIDALNDLDNRKQEAFKAKCVGWYANYLYLERARYTEQIKRYLTIFPDQQVKIILFEDLILNQNSVLSDILEFLGIEADRQHALTKDNVSGTPRSMFLKRLLDKRGILIGKLIPIRYRTPIKQWLMKLNTSNNKNIISQEERLVAARLLGFDLLVQETEQLLGKKIQCWRV